MGNSSRKRSEVMPSSYTASSFHSRSINALEHIPVPPILPNSPASAARYPQSSYIPSSYPASTYPLAQNPPASKYPVSSYPPKLSSFTSPFEIFSDAYYIPSSLKIVIPQLYNLPENELPVRLESRLFFITSGIKLEAVNQQSYSINFEYTSLRNSHLTVYLLARERLDPTSKVMSFVVDEKIQPKPKRFTLEKGPNKSFRNRCQLNLKGIEKEALEFEDQITYPFAVEIETEDLKSGGSQTYFSYFKITTESNSHASVNLKETVRIGGKYFRLHSLYEGKSIGQESECIICLNELRAIALLPCRHICYCKNCAIQVSEDKKSKCPVCRVNVDMFLHIQELF